MAGIGLELRRLLQGETFSSLVRAYGLGAILTLGPFLSSVLALAAITLFGPHLVGLSVRQEFAAVAVTIFGGSLVCTAVVQVVLTRYLADQLYRGRPDTMVESLGPALLVTSLLLGGTAIPVVMRLELDALATLLAVLLYFTVGAVWIVVVFISAGHGHRAVVAVFAIGSALAAGLGLAALQRFGLAGLLAGYTVGHAVILALLVRHLFATFGFPRRWDFRMLTYFRVFPALILIGGLQTLGVWIDKFVFWTSDLSVVAAGLATSPKYDSSTFLAYLTALPALVYTFVRLEADFADKFHAYYDEVFFKSSLESIDTAATNLRQAVMRAVLDVFKLQGVVTFLAAFYARELLAALGMPVSQIGMFRFAVIASFFLVVMMFANVVLLYLDRQLEVVAVVAAFFLINLILTLVTIRLGYQHYGLGFAAACLVGMLLSLFHVANQLHNLVYVTFARTPVLGSRPPRRTLLAAGGPWYGRYIRLGAGRRT